MKLQEAVKDYIRTTEARRKVIKFLKEYEGEKPDKFVVRVDDRYFEFYPDGQGDYRGEDKHYVEVEFIGINLEE